MDKERRDHLPPGRPAPRTGERPHVSAEAPAREAPHAQDHWRVDLGEEWEVTFWSREFRCSESDLRKAVEAVGTNAGTVRAYLAGEIQQQRS